MRSASRLLAAASLAFLSVVFAKSATRPRYGGTLRIEISATVTSLDPAAAPVSGNAEEEARARLMAMVFDRLTALDASAQALPQVATSWSHDSDNRKWQFILRGDVKLADGTRLSPQDAADSLKAANRDWRLTVSDNTVVIETNSPHPEMPVELALARNSIVHRGSEGGLAGTGPFRVSEFDAGRRAMLVANEDYWNGRPYVDAVEIAMGRARRDQLIDLELGRADVVELGPDELRHAAQENLRVIASSPSDLAAILFVPGRAAADDVRVRQALALSIDRAAICDVLLHKQGQPAGSLLPGWLSGYAFLFSARQDVAAAKQLQAQLANSPTLTLAYDAGESLARSIADRIALNARDAGLNVRVTALNGNAATPSVDARIVNEAPITANFREALAGMAEWLHEPVAQMRAEACTAEVCYEIERSLLSDYRVIPLFHLPAFVAVGPRVREWSVTPLGDWRPESVWLEAEKP